MEETLDYILTDYYHKSKVFLYPILGFARNEIYKPENSYLMFHHHTILTQELIVYYKHRRDDALFENFQNKRIADHPRLKACYWCEEGSIYIFDLIDYANDINFFLAGRYSAFSNGLKVIILKYLGDTIDGGARPKRYGHAVLFPELYQEQAAKQLGVEKKYLPEELADIYDLDKETLNIENYTPCGITTPSKITIPV